ncbi:MAG: hypothetical protein V3T53_01075 [Phycisphaerales bacterium]
MKTNVLPITAGVFGSLALTVSASGQFIGVSIEQIDLGAPECFVTYRVVAHFIGPDLMLAWGAFPGVAELHFWTGNGVNLLNGGGALDGLKFGDFAGFSTVEYDSWVTVGATGIAGNATDYSPGFIGSDGVTAAIVGNSFDDTDDGLVFNSNPKNPWFGPEVVMAQFTLAEGYGFHLEGVVVWDDAEAGGFFVTPFVVGRFVPPPCPGDLDGSGSVGAADLLSLLVSWGPCKGCCPADFDDDGNVGASDLLALLANWGLCP